MGSYSGWVAGYGTTGAQRLTDNGESGDTVNVSFAAVRTDT